ncbi:MAG TPA: L-histidine N(alpha)-methyltransferase [Gammaproteobacteria bacterium]|nr:L-histidine N(alpha)-methyltransferase [Gammaproteobacteria bacterium]
MNNKHAALKLHDLHPSGKDIRQDVLQGLQAPDKWISSMYFYDQRGSKLFDKITQLPEYYPTRTEQWILERYADEMAQVLGPDVMLVEPGSGSSEKIRELLAHLITPAGYVPVEISREHLLMAAQKIQDAYPTLEVLPVCADFTQPYDIPQSQHPATRRIIYFPGSTIGNFEPPLALDVLKIMREVARDKGALLIGVDLRKDKATLEAAYNDSAGVTAQFNINVLHRFNRELEANFTLDNFRHAAVWNEEKSRIEMYLISLCDQTVTIAGQEIAFKKDERIHTESSYKYTLTGFGELAASAGFSLRKTWTDDKQLFSVQYLEAV